jgi:predicted HicB family RNase H-like nuclease
MEVDDDSNFRAGYERNFRMMAAEKQMEVKRMAEALFARKPDWVTFYRETLGVHGIVRQMFPTRDALAEFEKTPAYQDVQQMLTNLRKDGPLPAEEEDPTRVITVRLPRSLHEALRNEAHEHRTSMNKLCISKLLQFIDNGNVPTEP